MRMKEFGLSTAAMVGIVVVVVAVVVVGVVAAVVLIGGGGPGGLPVYGGATKLTEGSYWGVTGSVYTFTDNAETVYKWYESNTPAGWTLYNNTGYTAGYGGSVIWEKGNDYGFAVILEGTTAQGYGADKVLILGAGPKTAITG